MTKQQIKAVEKEPDFQEVATKAGENAVAWVRKEIEALEHAQTCEGSQRTCPTCGGTGDLGGEVNGSPEDCPDCNDGTVSCGVVGKGSDAPLWHDEDAARQRIEEGPLSVEVRTGWHSPGDEEGAKPEEYNILLGTGGPASRIIGDLDEDGHPISAHYEYQDWFKPWTRARLRGDDEDVLLRWASVF